MVVVAQLVEHWVVVPEVAGSIPVDHPTIRITKKKLESMVVKFKPKLNFIDEFILFIKNFGVISLAIGVIIGQTTNNMVNSIVNNLLNPILGKLAGVRDLDSLVFYDIRYGAFISDLINFLLILFLVYLIIRFLIIYFLTDTEKEKFNFLNKEKTAKN